MAQSAAAHFDQRVSTVCIAGASIGGNRTAGKSPMEWGLDSRSGSALPRCCRRLGVRVRLLVVLIAASPSLHAAPIESTTPADAVAGGVHMRWRATMACIALLALAPIARAAQPGPGLMESVVRCARVLTDGYAQLYRKGATVTYGTVPVGYGHEKAAIVLFAMESYNLGNGYRQFLAVFFRNTRLRRAQPTYRSKWRLAAITMVGLDGWRVFKSATVAGDVIELSGSSWMKNDPMSDPTGVAHAAYRFAPYSLTEARIPVNGGS